MANNEDYLDALTAYSKSPGVDIPAVLDQYLNGVAKNGETLFQWQLLKPLIVGKMEQVLGDLRHRLSSENIPERPNVENLQFDVMHDRIMDALHKFNGAPFTIQRLCELLIDPKRHYKRSDKFLRGLEKNVLVVSTVDPFGRKVVSESGSKHLVNGVDTNGSPFFPRDSNISSNLPPVPGWVTTTATTRPQSSLPVDLPDQKLTKEQPHEDSPIPSNGSAVNSLYAEHGEQPPVVHSEEVIEETVVTMDTNEAGAVATDGGEAMAEEDDDDDEITDDTNASSSSSSPEEQSSSDTGESSGALTEVTTVTSSSETEARPWAEIVKEDDESSVSSDVDSLSSNATKECSERLSTELPPDKQANSPTSSEAEPGPSDHTQDDVADSLAESEAETSSDESVEQLPSACSVDTSTSEATDNVTDHQDVQSNESHSNDPSNVTESDITSDNLTSSDDKIPSTSSASETIFSSNDLHTQEASSSNSCDDTDINASSTTNSSSHLLNSSEECDSVAGLERLVDSVEPCQSQTLRSSTCTFLPTATKQNTDESSPLSSTFDCHIDCEEPQAKKCRLSDDESFSSLSPTMSDSVKTNIDLSTINDTPSGVDLMADTTSDSTSQIPAASWEDNSESQESLTTTSCSEKDLDIQDNMSDSNQEKISSPLSQLASSGDSQGFDAIEDMDHKKELDESQTQEEPKTITSEKAENVQEPMDQE